MTILQILKNVLRPRICLSNINEKICRYSTKSTSYDQVRRSLSQEEINNVLQCLNCLSSEEMSSAFRNNFYLSAVFREICRNREDSGPITSLREMTNIRYMGPKRLLFLCEMFKHGSDHVLNHIETQAEEEKKIKVVKTVNKYLKYFSPAWTAESLQSVRDVTCIQISRDGSHFTTVSKDLQLTAWDFVPLDPSQAQRPPTSLSNAEILEKAHRVVRHLPQSSHYLIELRTHWKLHENYMPLYIYITKFQMAVQALLNPDPVTSQQHRLYHVRDGFTKMLYNLTMDGERISCQHILVGMENGTFDHSLEVPPKFWNMFNDLSNSVHRERYANSLLVAYGFCSAVLHSKDAISEMQQSSDDETSPVGDHVT